MSDAKDEVDSLLVKSSITAGHQEVIPQQLGMRNPHLLQGAPGGDSLNANLHWLDIGDAHVKYNMNHVKRGLFIIINNKEFTNMANRTGTDLDAQHLKQTFEHLGFTVDVRDDLTGTNMEERLTAASQIDYRDMDCFGCAILTHGANNGNVFGIDGNVDQYGNPINSVPVEKLTNPFRGDKCRSLAGKPKMFFIQACRGTNYDDGILVSDDVVDGKHQKNTIPMRRIPAEADFLYAFSTTPGYYSWRNCLQGSWFVQALCKVMQEHGTHMELMQILTHTNRVVAYKFESSQSGEKQIPSIVSQLTKDIYFDKIVPVVFSSLGNFKVTEHSTLEQSK